MRMPTVATAIRGSATWSSLCLEIRSLRVFFIYEAPFVRRQSIQCVSQLGPLQQRAYAPIVRCQLAVAVDGKTQEIRVSDLTVTHQKSGREVLVGQRQFIRPELVLRMASIWRSAAMASRGVTASRMMARLEEIRTKPHCVIGQVAHPSCVCSANHR